MRDTRWKKVDHRTSEESENDCVYVKKPSTSKDASSNKRRKENVLVDKKKKKNILERRKTLCVSSDIDMKPTESGRTTSTQCHCRSNVGTLKKCRCQRFRQTANPNVSEADLSEHETRLVILEYIRSSARERMMNRSRSQSSVNSLESLTVEEQDLKRVSITSDDSYDPLREIEEMKEITKEIANQNEPVKNEETEYKVDKANLNEIHNQTETFDKERTLKKSEKHAKVVINEHSTIGSIAAAEDCRKSDEAIAESRANNGTKFKTIAMGEIEHQEYMEMLKQHLQNNSSPLNREATTTRSTKLGRSHSDITEQRLAHVKRKVHVMQENVQRWLDENTKFRATQVFEAIVDFDRNTLNDSKQKKNQTWIEKKNPNLR